MLASNNNSNIITLVGTIGNGNFRIRTPFEMYGTGEYCIRQKLTFKTTKTPDDSTLHTGQIELQFWDDMSYKYLKEIKQATVLKLKVTGEPVIKKVQKDGIPIFKHAIKVLTFKVLYKSIEFNQQNLQKNSFTKQLES